MKTNNFQKVLGQNLLIVISVPYRYLLDHNLVTTVRVNNDFEGHGYRHISFYNF